MSKAKAKAITGNIKILIKAGQAKPAPPIGPALGQAGLNIMNFCKDFNARTSHIRDDVPIPVRITAYSDKTFTFVTKTPPASYFIMKAAGVEKGSQKPGHSVAAEISAKIIYEIALIKQRESPHVSLESLCKSIAGTCRSMGVKVLPLQDPAGASGADVSGRQALQKSTLFEQFQASQ